jgi:hypothetical protein
MLIDMANKVQFKIYHSKWTVEYGLNGISNTNEWKVYVNEALERGWSFTMLVRSHAKIYGRRMAKELTPLHQFGDRRSPGD